MDALHILDCVCTTGKRTGYWDGWQRSALPRSVWSRHWGYLFYEVVFDVLHINFLNDIYFFIISIERGIKTSPKLFSASKCDVGNWIFSKLWIFEKFFGNSLDFLRKFLEDFMGGFLEGFFWEDFFGGGFLWEDFLGGIFLGRIFLGGILCLHY